MNCKRCKSRLPTYPPSGWECRCGACYTIVLDATYGIQDYSIKDKRK